MNYIISAILLSITLIGCSKSNDEHIFTLYSSYRNNRLPVATFDTEPISWKDKNTDEQFIKWFAEDNFKECSKVAKLLENEWVNTVKNNDIKYWCEKGRYRK